MIWPNLDETAPCNLLSMSIYRDPTLQLGDQTNDLEILGPADEKLKPRDGLEGVPGFQHRCNSVWNELSIDRVTSLPNREISVSSRNEFFKCLVSMPSWSLDLIGFGTQEIQDTKIYAILFYTSKDKQGRTIINWATISFLLVFLLSTPLQEFVRISLDLGSDAAMEKSKRCVTNAMMQTRIFSLHQDF